MKKLLTGLLAVAMAFTLIGCAEQQSEEIALDKQFLTYGLTMQVPDTWSDLTPNLVEVPIFEDSESDLGASYSHSSNAEETGGVLITHWEGDEVSADEIKQTLGEMDNTTQISEVTINGIDMIRRDIQGAASTGVMLAPIVDGVANFQITINFDNDVFKDNEKLLEAIINSIKFEDQEA